MASPMTQIAPAGRKDVKMSKYNSNPRTTDDLYNAASVDMVCCDLPYAVLSRNNQQNKL